RGRGGLPMSTRTHGSERGSPPATVWRVAERRLKHWGWGYEDEQPSHEEVTEAAAFITDRLGVGSAQAGRPGALAGGTLAAPRISPPRALEEICRSDTHDRALHAYGRSYRDIVRAFRGRFDDPPDVVAHPRDEDEVRAVLDWAVSAGAAVTPLGGGTRGGRGVRRPAGGRARVGFVDLNDVDTARS